MLRDHYFHTYFVGRYLHVMELIFPVGFFYFADIFTVLFASSI